MCLVTWPWIGSEAGADFVLYKPRCFSYVDHTVLILTSFRLHLKSSDVIQMTNIAGTFNFRMRRRLL